MLAVGEGVEEVAVDLRNPQLVEAPHERQVASLVGGDAEVRGTEEERLVALIGAAVDQVGRLGVGARDDDAGNAHDVELKAGGIEALDLLVRGDQHLAALVAALLGARALVLDVIPRNAGLDEAADQVAHMGIAAVAGVGVGDDEWAVVVGRGRGALRLAHPQAQILLVAVGGEQRAHQRRRLIRHLAQGIAREIGPRILGGGTLGGGRPAAEVDALDPHPLHGHRLPRRVGAEGGDALAPGKELAQALMERRRRFARHRVVDRDRAALLDHLSGRIKTNDPPEAGAVEVPPGGGDLLLEWSTALDGWFRFDDGHGFTPLEHRMQDARRGRLRLAEGREPR